LKCSGVISGIMIMISNFSK